MKSQTTKLDNVLSLSKLTVSNADRARLEQDMQTVLDFASTLPQDLDGEAPTELAIRPTVFQEDMAEDTVKESTCTQQELLRSAEEKNDEYVCVPKSFE